MTGAWQQLDRTAKLLRQDFDNGEITFRGNAISVLINKSPTVKWRDGDVITKNVKFLPKGFSTVRVMKDAIEELPDTGEVFTETKTRNNSQVILTHRIQEIQNFELSYLCLCKIGGAE